MQQLLRHMTVPVAFEQGLSLNASCLSLNELDHRL